MMYLHKAIAAFLILLLGILAKDKGGTVTFVVSVLVASAVLSTTLFLAGFQAWALLQFPPAFAIWIYRSAHTWAGRYAG